jgi:hypothetical protein
MSKRRALLLLLAAVLLAGCLGKPATPATPAAPTPAVVEPCLVGIWEVADNEQFLRALLPADAFDAGSLAYQSSKGAAAYNFGADGQLGFLATQLEGNFSSGAEKTPLLLKLDGYAAADYRVDGDTIAVGTLRQAAMQLQALLDKTPMLDNPRPGEFLPLFVNPYIRARYTCSGDALSLKIQDDPRLTQPLQLKRSK